MGTCGPCPVYDGNNHSVCVDAGASDCQACPLVSPSTYWLLFHLGMSFVLVAYVRWSRVVIHNHACNERLLSPCCRHQPQHSLPDTIMETGTYSANDKLTNAKENGVLPPTLTLSREAQHSAARVVALRTEYASYLHMLKVGLPRAVVNHKLRVDSKDPKVLDELLAMQRSTKVAPIIVPLLDKPLEVKLPDRTQKIASSLRMVQGRDPNHLVEPKAMKKTSAESEIGATLSDTLEPANDVTISRRASISSLVSTAPSSPDAFATPWVFTTTDQTETRTARCKMNMRMRKKLHWSATPFTDSIVSSGRNSLWNRMHAKEFHDRVCISKESRQWMEKLFAQAGTKAKGSRRWTRSEISDKPLPGFHVESKIRSRSSSDDVNEMEDEPVVAVDEQVRMKRSGIKCFQRKRFVMLVDSKKSQNIAIVLARVKRTFPERAREILTLKCSVLSSPTLQSLIDMWPDSAEQEAIDQFHGDLEILATADRFLIAARNIPRAQQKLRCLQFKLDFIPRVTELRNNVKLLSRGIEQVCASDRFAGVFEYIFHLGNLLNFGEGVAYTDWIKSIPISSLTKLSFTKAFDGRTTFLQYVIQSVERDEPHLAFFRDQLSLITQCSKLSFQTLLAEYESLNAGLHLLINETQKTAINTADLHTDLIESQESMRLYVMEVERELEGVRELVNALKKKRQEFFNYFEEEESLPIDELLGVIARFAQEYSRERHQLMLGARQAQKATRNICVASVHHLTQKCPSL